MRMAGIYIQRDNRRCRVIKQAQPDMGRKRNKEGRSQGGRKEEGKERNWKKKKKAEH